MSMLVTPSLLSTIDWAQNCPSSWKEKADKDLHNQLGRIWEEGPHYFLDLGKRFEDLVYMYAQQLNVVNKGSDHFRWFVDQCKGGVFQKRTRKVEKIGDFEFCLYGKMDAWWPNIIKDIKTTSNYKMSKYLASFQHKLYCYTEQIPDFEYLVAVFEPLTEEEQKAGKVARILDHHIVAYHVNSFEALREEVHSKILSMHTYLSSNAELYELYTKKFTQF